MFVVFFYECICRFIRIQIYHRHIYNIYENTYTNTSIRYIFVYVQNERHLSIHAYKNISKTQIQIYHKHIYKYITLLYIQESIYIYRLYYVYLPYTMHTTLCIPPSISSQYNYFEKNTHISSLYVLYDISYYAYLRMYTSK